MVVCAETESCVLLRVVFVVSVLFPFISVISVVNYTVIMRLLKKASPVGAQIVVNVVVLFPPTTRCKSMKKNPTMQIYALRFYCRY